MSEIKKAEYTELVEQINRLHNFNEYLKDWILQINKNMQITCLNEFELLSLLREKKHDKLADKLKVLIETRDLLEHFYHCRKMKII